MRKTFSINPFLFLYTALILCTSLFSQEFDTDLMFYPTDQKKGLIPEFDDSYGVLFRDINGSGGPEIYSVRFRNLNRYFVNSKQGKAFKEKTIQTGLGGNLEPRQLDNLELGAASADIDNDGFEDIMIIGWGSTTRIFHQSSKKVFTDITEESGLPLPISGNGATFADIDLDGDLDVFITDEHDKNHLLIQTKINGFEDRTDAFGLSGKGISQTATFADLNGDNFPELYVCNWLEPDKLYKNLKGNGFQEIKLPLTHLNESYNSNNASFGDIDNDGDLDLLVTDRHGQSRLYENTTHLQSGQISFGDITRKMGLENFYPSYSGILADFDNNGWLDIYFTNIGPNLLYTNDQGIFELAYMEGTKKYYSTGAAIADMDNDGDLDLFVANKDTNSVLYTNPLKDSHFLRFKLEGITSNRNAIGAKVWLLEDINDQIQLVGFRQAGTTSGYLSGDERIIHFGVPAPGNYHVKVEFPSGIERELVLTELDKTYRISEFTGVVKWFYLALDKSSRLFTSATFWLNFGLYVILIGLLSGFVGLVIRRYLWTVKNIVIYLSCSLLGLYIESESLQATSRSIMVIVQIGSLFLVSSIIITLWERIHQLQKKRFGYRNTLQSFSDHLLYIRDNQEMAVRVTEVLLETLSCDHASFWILRGNDATMLAQSGTSLGIDKTHLSEKSKAKLKKTMFLDSGFLEMLTGNKEINPSITVPVKDEKDVYAFIVLKSFLDLLNEDESILSIIASQIALTMANNQYIEETKILVKKVTESEIREKYIHELELKNTELETLYSELKQTQTQLIHSEKMSSLGQLVAGIAHELNNPIGYIYANMNELKEAVTRLKQSGEINQDEVDSIITDSMEGSRRVKEIVESLRKFSRLDEETSRPIDIHEGLESTLQLMRKEFSDRINIVKSFGDIPLVTCQGGQINQVFMNILINAAQSIENKGVITITTSADDKSVFIKIQDSGQGIEEEKLAHIFDPFYTTKPIGQGTGLGLSISYGIITNHKGTLVVKSQEGKGSTFTISLPRDGNLS